jgi:pimeloyl-ACP methyl ester carboxylesterase
MPRYVLPILRLVTVATCMLAAAPSRADGTPPVPELDWRPCAEYPDWHYECATARVPLDYDRPRGPKTKIALARIRASDPARRIGTLFLNPGGPGGSGVDLLFDYGDYMAERLKGRFDIVGFDPRGVARSEPLYCFRNYRQLDEYLWLFPYLPYTAAQERPYFAVTSSLAEKCLARGQRIIGHMSTADVARDLDLLREAVGDQKLSFVGWSYGSYIGNTYANLFPARVRALVIDGVLDPRLWASGWHIRIDRTATAAEFEEFLRLCDESGCPLSGRRGASQRFFALARALRDVPLLLDDGTLYSYDYLVADAADAMYEPEYWRDYGEFFASLIDASRGVTGAAARARAQREAIRRRLERAERTNYWNDWEGYYGNQCADTQYPRSFERYREVAQFAEAGSIFGPYWWWMNASCARWPVAEDRYVGPWDTRTSRPVLIVGNLFDGITDYAGAVVSSKLLRNSRLLTYAGWGHTAYGRSECVTRHVDAYLLRGTLPGEGTVCPANPNPFEVAALRMTAPPSLPAVARPPSGRPGRRPQVSVAHP